LVNVHQPAAVTFRKPSGQRNDFIVSPKELLRNSRRVDIG
jgi:hypothetical protein